MTSIAITPFDNLRHRDPIIALWQSVFGYETAHNRPDLVIDKKTAVNDGLFFVATAGAEVVGTIMAGYDGHRSWTYSVAVHPAHRKQGIGSALVSHAERALAGKGCLKINLQIMEGNESVAAFYSSPGYLTEKRVSMGKRMNENTSFAQPSG